MVDADVRLRRMVDLRALGVLDNVRAKVRLQGAAEASLAALEARLDALGV